MSQESSGSVTALPLRAVWGHGTLGLPLAVIGYPLSIWIPAHHAGALGLPLATVGTMLMLARFTDVIIDPLIGELSDRFRSPLGRRRPSHPWRTPDDARRLATLRARSRVGLAYFLLWLTPFFLGATASLPHAAWGAELSHYHQRSRVTAARRSRACGPRPPPPCPWS